MLRCAFHSLRFIYWPRAILQELCYSPKISMQKLSEELANVHTFSEARTFDAQASFNQVPLAEEAQPFYAMQDVEGNTYFMKVLPMGHSVSPELMDLLSKIIGGVPGYAQKQFCSPSTVSVTTYIDNFRFGRCEDATEEQYCTTIENFLRRCANAHLLLNEEDRSGAYCGAVYNFCAKTVALKASFIKKLCSMQQPTTPRDVERVFGLLNFGGQVLSAPVHKWFEAISWYRKLANALERGTVHRDELLRVPIPQQVQDELLQWRSFCLSNAPAVKCS